MKNDLISTESRRLSLSVGILLFIICFASACEQTHDAKKTDTNVLIISIESLRWDHLGCYGYSRPITPNIDKLAGGGVIFDRAYAQSSWTKPSIASTLTSSFPSYHEMTNKSSPESEKQLFPVLRDGFQSMAPFFSKNGYNCYGWTANRHLWKDFGFGRGFKEYSARIGDKSALTRSIEVIKSDKMPWFIFMHIMAPHWEYSPPQQFRIYDKHPNGISIKGDNWTEICDGKIRLSPEDLDHNIALYDGEIAYADHMVGQLLDALKSSAKRDSALIVVTSDHGEEFLDHGGVGHGRTLYEELIRVPLIFAGPGVPQGRHIGILAQNIDIFPTLAGLLGLKLEEGLQGLSLTPLFQEKPAKWKRRYVYSEVEMDQHVLIGNKFKYIWNPLEGHEELYDIIEDPKEKNNLADVAIYEKIKINLSREGNAILTESRRLSKSRGAMKSVKAPAEVMDKLKDLGYLK